MQQIVTQRRIITPSFTVTFILVFQMKNGVFCLVYAQLSRSEWETNEYSIAPCELFSSTTLSPLKITYKSQVQYSNRVYMFHICLCMRLSLQVFPSSFSFSLFIPWKLLGMISTDELKLLKSFVCLICFKYNIKYELIN